MQGEGFYTVEEAAQALKLTPDRIRQMLRDGELDGVPPQEGGASGWKIPIRVIPGRDRPPPPIDRSESPTTGPESLSGPEDIRGEEEPGPTPAQPQRDDAAEHSREATAPPPHRVTVQEAARILETSVDALLEAKDEAIADLRDRVAFLERQLEGRAEEIRRRDHIIAALTERIPPAIEAPDHERPPRARESTVEEPTRVTPSGAGGPREEGSQRPWWRRAFGR
jgi:excisionase family DNA binding protein